MRRRVRDRMFGRASEGHFQRRTSDWIRLAAGIVVLLIAARHAGDVSASERALNDLVVSMSDPLNPAFLAIYGIGTLWAIGLVVVAALVGRRWRLARDLLVAGGVTWVAARLTGEIVVAHETFRAECPCRGGVRWIAAVSYRARRRGRCCDLCGGTIRDTTVHASSGVCSWSRSRSAALSLGRSYPNDLLAAVILGWTVAAAVHLLFGSPGGRPTVEQVRAALAQLGIDARDVRLADAQPTGSTLMFADDGEHVLRVKVIGRDQADARLLAKLWRSVAYLDSGPPLTLTRLHQLEREAYLMLLARDAGVRVPPVLVVAKAGQGSACLVVGTVGAVPLAELESEQVTDELLESIWEGVAGAPSRAGRARSPRRRARRRVSRGTMDHRLRRRGSDDELGATGVRRRRIARRDRGNRR